MQIAKYKTIIALLLMMNFIGQALASGTMACPSQSSVMQMQDHTDMAMQDVVMMDHSRHSTMDTASDTGKMDHNCCPDCDCVYGSCAAALVSSYYAASAPQYPVLGHSYNASLRPALITSLFRPPISR